MWNVCRSATAASALIKWTCVIFRHSCYRPAALRPSWGKWKTDLTHGERCWEPQAEHRTRPGNRWLLRHFTLRPPQRPIRGRDQPVRRGRLRGVRVSHTNVFKMHEKDQRLRALFGEGVMWQLRLVFCLRLNSFLFLLLQFLWNKCVINVS